jgi:hypothetical protein
VNGGWGKTVSSLTLGFQPFAYTNKQQWAVNASAYEGAGEALGFSGSVRLAGRGGPIGPVST